MIKYSEEVKMEHMERTLAQFGIRGRKAGEKLRKSLIELIKATGRAEDAFKKLGLVLPKEEPFEIDSRHIC